MYWGPWFESCHGRWWEFEFNKNIWSTGDHETIANCQTNPSGSNERLLRAMVPMNQMGFSDN